MSTSPVRGKPPAAKSQPNLLDQIGKAWNELTAGKKPAAAPRPASNKPKLTNKPANQPTSKHATKTLTKTADRADPARQAYSDRVRREGTALQRQQAQELSLRLPQKTEFKQGKANELEGLSNDVQLNIRKAEAFGSKLAHSRIIGVAQLGEGVGMATDAVKGLHGAIRGTPKFLRDTGDLITGRTKTKPGEIEAGRLSGAGKFAWGGGAGLVDIAARLVVPGDWRDGIASGMQQGQQALDNGYRGVVKKIGIDPDSKAYGVASTVTQVVGTVVSMGKGGKSAIGGKGGLPAPVKTVKPVKVTRTLPRPGNPVTNPAVRSAVAQSIPANPRLVTSSQLLPPLSVRYGNGTPSLRLAAAGLAQAMPGLHVNPLRSVANCISSSVALAFQRAGRPGSALAAAMTDASDLHAFYGRLPEQGFGAKVGSAYLLPPTTRFDINSLQRYVSSLPHGARGIVLVRYEAINHGHALVIENIKGRATFMDGQSGMAVHPKAVSSGAVVMPDRIDMPQWAVDVKAGRNIPDLKDVNYMFIRTDDVVSLRGLPKGTRQGIVTHIDVAGQRARVTDAVSHRERWVAVDPKSNQLGKVRLGENVYTVQNPAGSGKTAFTQLIPQGEGLRP
jgi:hypothetical protein